jgi:hypothetical protein
MTLAASGRERSARLAARLGAAWGAGHATSLFAFGVPIVLYRAYLPEPVQRAAETCVGLLIVALALWLLLRWRRGEFRAGAHTHARTRSVRTAFGIGIVHGTGGSAGVGVLLLASIRDQHLALAALGVFAVCTALSMAVLSTGLGRVLHADVARRSFHRVAPALGAVSLVFGVWYALGAQGLVRYGL